jgi:hypothetical protein
VGYVLLLAGLAIYLRLWGGAMRLESIRSFQAVGWLACGVAGWLAACAAGAQSPFWSAALPAAIGFSIGLALPSRVVYFAADVATVLLATQAARPPLEMSATVAIAMAAGIAGVILDAVLLGPVKRWRTRSVWN